MVARFHAAFASFDYAFKFVRAGVHDTGAHLARLRSARSDGPLAGLADAILDEAERLPSLGALPARVTHGDLKISNVLFRADRAVALLDLDTMGRLNLAYELGDALRSWCNPLGEDVEQTRFDLEVFAAALRGYASRAQVTRAEIDSIVDGLYTNCVELAARFCTDAYEDKYFGWDPGRFPSRSEHNRVRSTGQLNLARAVAAARAQAESLVRESFI